MRLRWIIAIDGPAGAGKSTVARRLAQRLGYRFLDTGALYRAVTLAALRSGIDPTDEVRLAALTASVGLELREQEDGTLGVLLDGEDVSAEIRGAAVTTAVSVVAALPRVRASMVPFQRAFAANGGTVAEGRDIGTVVFPDADAKFFLHADPAERARRRAVEDSEQDVERVRTEIDERDRRDSSRSVAPLRAAPDAIRVDTTRLTIDEVVECLAIEIARRSEDPSDGGV